MLPGYIQSTAIAINSSGEITGLTSSSTGQERGFVYKRGVTTIVPQDASVIPWSINDKGVITGQVYTNEGLRPFISSDDVFITLQAPSGANFSIGRSINNQGDVVGEWGTPTGYPRAFLYANGVTRDLGTLSGGLHSYAAAINNSGVIVGESDVPDRGITAARYIEGQGWVELESLIRLGSGWRLQTPTAINDRGQIIGIGRHDGLQRAFMLTPVE